ncbi:MAG: hypothetical protein F6K41_26275 [Symploca sp. SIO3E6]|nr:hypothetical protein [Caldora sp. SIO3E6]
MLRRKEETRGRGDAGTRRLGERERGMFLEFRCWWSYGIIRIRCWRG